MCSPLERGGQEGLAARLSRSGTAVSSTPCSPDVPIGANPLPSRCAGHAWQERAGKFIRCRQAYRCRWDRRRCHCRPARFAFRLHRDLNGGACGLCGAHHATACRCVISPAITTGARVQGSDLRRRFASIPHFEFRNQNSIGTIPSRPTLTSACSPTQPHIQR